MSSGRRLTAAVVFGALLCSVAHAGPINISIFTKTGAPAVGSNFEIRYTYFNAAGAQAKGPFTPTTFPYQITETAAPPYTPDVRVIITVTHKTTGDFQTVTVPNRSGIVTPLHLTFQNAEVGASPVSFSLTTTCDESPPPCTVSYTTCRRKLFRCR